ncbi:hypothetical protein RI367_000280 [Sorochytrium milnesiophthora]
MSSPSARVIAILRQHGPLRARGILEHMPEAESHRWLKTKIIKPMKVQNLLKVKSVSFEVNGKPVLERRWTVNEDFIRMQGQNAYLQPNNSFPKLSLAPVSENLGAPAEQQQQQPGSTQPLPVEAAAPSKRATSH